MTTFTEEKLLTLCSNSKLDLNNKQVRDEDIIDIVNFLNGHPQITTVDLRGNELGDVGARDFALHNKTATTVDLSLNDISAVGAKGFALHNKTATTVDLSRNELDNTDKQALAAILASLNQLSNNQLTSVDIPLSVLNDAMSHLIAKSKAVIGSVKKNPDVAHLPGIQAFRNILPRVMFFATCFEQEQPQQPTIPCALTPQ